MKTRKIFCITLALLLLLCGCARSDDGGSSTLPQGLASYNDESSTSGESDPEGVDIGSYLGQGEPLWEDDGVEPPLDDVVQSMAGYGGMGAAMFLSPEDEFCFEPLIYNGGDFVFYYQVGSSYDAEHAIAFMLNGVYQDIKIEYDGVTTDYATKHIVSVPAGPSKIYKVMLRPNIGKAGDVLLFCNASIRDPNSLVAEDDKSYALSEHGLVPSLLLDFTMNADSTNTASVNENYSRATIGDYENILKQWFDAMNDTDDLCQFVIYHDLEKNVFLDDGVGHMLMSSSRIDAEVSKSFPLTLAMSGRVGTTQRISLYINEQIQPVFDGKYYADVKIEKNKQTTVYVDIDTTKLGEWNSLYAIAVTLDGDRTDLSKIDLNQSKICVLKVDK